jgi:hypothetical protein
MKQLSAAFLTAMVVTSASADEVYHGMAMGNSDLYPHNLERSDAGRQEPTVGIQPGVGDAVTGQRLQGRRSNLLSGSDPTQAPFKPSVDYWSE